MPRPAEAQAAAHAYDRLSGRTAPVPYQPPRRSAPAAANDRDPDLGDLRYRGHSRHRAGLGLRALRIRDADRQARDAAPPAAPSTPPRLISNCWSPSTDTPRRSGTATPSGLDSKARS